MKLSLLLSVLSATALAVPIDITIASDVAVIPRAVDAFAVAAPKGLLERTLSTLGFRQGPQVKKDSIEKRRDDTPESFIVTDEVFRRVRVYYRNEIDAAIDEGFRRYQANQLTTPWGTAETRYPHQYNDNDGRIRALPNRPSNGPYIEFPILHQRNNGSPNLYAGGNPRRDRVVFDRDGNFITIMAHSEHDNSFYPGHAVIYNPAGNRFQLTDSNRYSGSNPEYSTRWGVAAVLTMFIQNFRARVDGGGSW